MTERESDLSFRINIPSDPESIAFPIPEQRVPLITDYEGPTGDALIAAKAGSKREKLRIAREQLGKIIASKPQHNYSE